MNQAMKQTILFLISFFTITTNLNAQQSANQVAAYDTLSLEDLMNIKITVASIKELTARESPGIISYITADDLRQSGARDLMDVLQHIPGFEFGVDVEGVVGLAVRGNWAHEGKAVLLIDGQEMNDGLYSTLQFGNHYPIENIERVEIIRGPGSAMYGGNAAYAVINVITRTAQHKFEVQSSTFYGATKNDFSRRGANLFLGSKSDKNSISIQSFASQGQRSHEEYKDVYGDSVSLKGNSDLNNFYVNVGATIGNLGIRAIADVYSVKSYDEYQSIVPIPLLMHFNSYLGEINYELKINAHWKIIPKLNYKYQLPWAYAGNNDSLDSTDIPFWKSSERYSGSIASIFDPNDNVNISGGASYFYDHSKNLKGNNNFLTTLSPDFTYNNFALFLQTLIKVKEFNIIGGVRYNDNSRYSSTLVPRIGVTTIIDKFHFKVLYSKSFRSPSTENIDLASSIKPEVTNVFEFETGYSINEYSLVALNAYIIQTHNPIVYYFDTLTNFDAYTNISKTGTNGLEFSYRYKKAWCGIDIGASYYRANDGKQINSYSIPQNEEEHLGLAPFKGDIALKIALKQNIFFNAGATFYSSRTQIAKVDANGNSIYSKLSPTSIINLQFEYRFIKAKGLSVQCALFNLLDNSQWYIQPYNSNHAPLPGMGREFQLKVLYQNF